MKKSTRAILPVLLILAFGARAQQLPQYSQYMFNNYLLNPAVGGIEDFLDLKTGFRKQWVGIDGAPTTFYATIHGAIKKPQRDETLPYGQSRGGLPSFGGFGKGNGDQGRKRTYVPIQGHHGVGGIIRSDQTGPLSTASVHGTYAYHLRLAQDVQVSAGVAAGLLQYSFDPSKATTEHPDDPAIYPDKVNRRLFDLGTGLWLYSSRFYLGASGSQLLKQRLRLSRTEADRLDRVQRHYYFTGGYQFAVSPDFLLVPSALVKMARPTPVSIDINLKTVYRELLWLGVSYRNQDAVVGMLGLVIKDKFNVGYSYDYNFSKLHHVSSNGHEIMVGVQFNKEKKRDHYWLPWW